MKINENYLREHLTHNLNELGDSIHSGDKADAIVEALNFLDHNRDWVEKINRTEIISMITNAKDTNSLIESIIKKVCSETIIRDALKEHNKKSSKKKSLTESVSKKKSLKEGTSNFNSLDKLPLLTFMTWDEIVDTMEAEDDYPNYNDFEDEDDYYAAVEEFQDNYLSKNKVCILDEDDVDDLRADLDQFNYDTKMIAYDLDVDENGYQQYGDNLNLEDIELTIEPGYYEGGQIDCKHENYFDYLDEDVKKAQLERFNNFLNEMKSKYGLSKLSVSARFSNGETWYKVDENLKEDVEKQYFLRVKGVPQQVNNVKSQLEKEGYEIDRSDVGILFAKVPSQEEGIKKAQELIKQYSSIVCAVSTFKFEGLEEGYDPLSDALRNSGKQPLFVFDDGTVYGVEYKDGKLYAGSISNAGMSHQYEIDYDDDLDIDVNLQNLYTKIIESDPELLGEGLDDNISYVIYKENGKYKGTPKSNYDAQVRDANMVQDFSKFNDANKIVDYLTKYTDYKDKNTYKVIDEELSEDNNSLARKMGAKFLPPKDYGVKKKKPRYVYEVYYYTEPDSQGDPVYRKFSSRKAQQEWYEKHKDDPDKFDMYAWDDAYIEEGLKENKDTNHKKTIKEGYYDYIDKDYAELLDSDVNVYDVKQFVLDESDGKYRTHYTDDYAIIVCANGKGCIVDYEAVGQDFDSVKSKIKLGIEENKDNEYTDEQGVTHKTLNMFATHLVKTTPEEIIEKAPKKTMKYREFFRKYKYNDRCASNFKSLAEYINENDNLSKYNDILDDAEKNEGCHSKKKGKKLKEGYIGQTLNDFFYDCVEPENIEKITLWGEDDVIYEGDYDGAIDEFGDNEFIEFDCGMDKVVVNVDTSEEYQVTDYYVDVEEFIEFFNGDEIEVYDLNSGETLFSGYKEDCPDDVLEKIFISFDAPNYISINIEENDSDDDFDESLNEKKIQGYSYRIYLANRDKDYASGYDYSNEIDMLNDAKKDWQEALTEYRTDPARIRCKLFKDGEWYADLTNIKEIDIRIQFINKYEKEFDENLKEDTVKQDGKWVNKGDTGKTHGTFKTKKEADAQRKAMFVNKKKNANWGK